MPRGTQGSVCPFRPPAPPKPIPRCLEQHRSVILHDSCDPEWSQRPHFLDSLKPHADVGIIDEKSGLRRIQPSSSPRCDRTTPVLQEPLHAVIAALPCCVQRHSSKTLSASRVCTPDRISAGHQRRTRATDPRKAQEVRELHTGGRIGLHRQECEGNSGILASGYLLRFYAEPFDLAYRAEGVAANCDFRQPCRLGRLESFKNRFKHTPTEEDPSQEFANRGGSEIGTDPVMVRKCAGTMIGQIRAVVFSFAL